MFASFVALTLLLLPVELAVLLVLPLDVVVEAVIGVGPAYFVQIPSTFENAVAPE